MSDAVKRYWVDDPELHTLLLSDDGGVMHAVVLATDYDALEAENVRVTEERNAALNLLRQMGPAIRDIMWCALVWNDHNFTEKDLLDKATRAAKSVGLDRYNGVDAINHWMARVDAALAASNDKGDE